MYLPEVFKTLCILGVILFFACAEEPPSPVVNRAQTARLETSPATGLDFGELTVGSELTSTLRLTNTGDIAATDLLGSLALSRAFSYAGGTFPGSGGDCTNRLEPGKSCGVVVRFAPTFAEVFQEPTGISYFNGFLRDPLDRVQLAGQGKAL